MLSWIPVFGYCPSCGQSKLMVPEGGGAVLCHHFGCEEPTAAHDILGDSETSHMVTIRPKDFTLRHPLIERIDNRLMDCTVNQMLVDLDTPPPPGEYRVKML